MPNWCKNNLKIKGNGEKVLELLELMKDEDGQMTFNKLVPMPKELENTEAPTPENMSEKKKKYLLEKCGATNWYDWHCKNWGCKWDASESAFYQRGNDWYISFQTPWGPPIEFIQKVSKQFNKMTFELQYADEGYGQQPLGEAIISEGSVMYDGPEEGTTQAEAFGNRVWDEEWVDNWENLEGERRVM